MTSTYQIDYIKEICLQLTDNPLIESCEINDYGRYGNFEIFLYPKIIDRTTTNKLKKIVKDAIKEIKATKENREEILNLKIRQYFSPVPIKKWCYFEEKNKISGYNRKYWAFDLDFLTYHNESNSFSN